MERDYQLAERLSRAGDDLLVDPFEVAALSGLSQKTIQQRKIVGLPQPIPGVRRLLWRLGDIRVWMRGSGRVAEQCAMPQRRRGRPTKPEQLARAREHEQVQQ